ncbi:MAG: hypothetical protein BWX80_04046 [Candidatus Hydrogenedentes bacterium ADurb.Bin101]|nr:MAG: hypothetical protein BWX80_04046 [Candidatus Hydrogenedentes bacterium ADurb.Bin101]
MGRVFRFAQPLHPFRFFPADRRPAPIRANKGLGSGRFPAYLAQGNHRFGRVFYHYPPLSHAVIRQVGLFANPVAHNERDSAISSDGCVWIAHDTALNLRSDVIALIVFGCGAGVNERNGTFPVVEPIRHAVKSHGIKEAVHLVDPLGYDDRAGVVHIEHFHADGIFRLIAAFIRDTYGHRESGGEKGKRYGGARRGILAHHQQLRRRAVVRNIGAQGRPEIRIGELRARIG